MYPPMIIFGVLLFLALIYQTVAIVKKETPYPRRAALYSMVFGVAVSMIISAVIGQNTVGNAIGTGAISLGHI